MPPSMFNKQCRQQIRKYWSKHNQPMDPELEDLIQTTLTTQDFIDALRKFKPLPAEGPALLDKAESVLSQIKSIKRVKQPHPYNLTNELVLIFGRFSSDLFKRMYWHELHRTKGNLQATQRMVIAPATNTRTDTASKEDQDADDKEWYIVSQEEESDEEDFVVVK